MRIKTITLKGFKRFDDLTIELGDQPARIIALVGPNGSGKSSVFDAFEEKQKEYKGNVGSETQEFYSKFAFSPEQALQTQPYSRGNSIRIVTAENSSNFDRRSFYIRSAYRFTPKLNLQGIRPQPDVLEDSARPTSSIAVDSRFEQDYERLLGQAFGEFERGDLTGNQVRAQLLGEINTILRGILEVEVSTIGSVSENRGQLYFNKDDAKDFPYQNLSSGEKEVINLVLDLYVKRRSFDDTVYCIDEPELHLNTGIQRKLLIEIERLIPPNCQLWIATHSAGFLRALQEELKDKCAVLDFSEADYFRGAHTITPMPKTRANWQRIFATALDDLAGLLAPKRIVYCEGKPEPRADRQETGLDAAIYNEIFKNTHADTLFISSGGSSEMVKNSALALQVLKKAFLDVELLLLRDRDDCSDAERNAFVAETYKRMLLRREIENYVFDRSILEAFCSTAGRQFDATAYEGIVSDIANQDLKKGDTLAQLKEMCAFPGNLEQFKRQLASHVAVDGPVYIELDSCIFTLGTP